MADPVDEAYWRTFYLGTIGVWASSGTNSVADYRARLLSLAGGVMPKNLKVGISWPSWFMRETLDEYYDFIYCPYEAGRGMDYHIDLARSANVPFGMHINGMPWGDSAKQSDRHLHNFLEEYAGGTFLQSDRFGRVRKAGLPQDPTLDEQGDAQAPALEMQLTLSRNATMLQDYVARNNRISLRTLEWYREQFPDVIQFASMSSEYAQNVAANNEYCDYSAWSKQEFRDWLGGAGLYAGHAQYPSLTAFNAAFSGEGGFPWTSWSAVQPPTAVNWTGGTPNGNWWLKWHQFRVAQVQHMVQSQINWSREAGWSPDRLFGHQIPFDPASTTEPDVKYASPWTTAFVNGGSGGVTAYGATASSMPLFNALYADDKNWGIFEYNPMVADVPGNLAALDSAWNGRAHIICPYKWIGVPQLQIRNSPFETALQQFISEHSRQTYSGLARYEVAPSSKDVIWSMSGSNDVEQLTQITNHVFTNGLLCATATATNTSISLALDETRHLLISDAYFAASFRLAVSNAAPGGGRIAWQDESNQTWSASFTPRPGTNVYHLNLSENPSWREKRIKRIDFSPGVSPDAPFALDWFRLEANHCWHFDDPNEVFGINQFTNATVSNGSFSGVSGPDGYLYLSTDKRNPAAHADRAFINADFYKKVRFRLAASAGGTAQIYWWKRDGGPFMASFPVHGGARAYEYDLSGNPDWSGSITRFRLDPVNFSGVSCSLDYLNISPVLLPPRVANIDLIANSDHPLFVWEEPIEPAQAGLKYSFQLAGDFSFTNVIWNVSGLTGTSYTYPGVPALDGLCWWRVRSCDSTGNQSPWTVPVPVFIRMWHFVNPNDISLLNQISLITQVGGFWQGLTTGADPCLDLNIGSGKDRGINADLYKHFCLRAKITTPIPGNVALFSFFPRAGNGPVSVPVSFPGDDQWHDLDLDLSRNPDWKGYIGGIRFAPTAQSNVLFSLASAKLLPVAVPPANTPPVLAPIPNYTIQPGESLRITNSASAPGSPPGGLAYGLMNGPVGAVINVTNGLFTWRPSVLQAGTTNWVGVQVTDIGTPALSATQSFAVVVKKLSPPVIRPTPDAREPFRMLISGDSGPDYSVQVSTNLADWKTVFSTNSPVLPFGWTDTNGGFSSKRFYRIRLSP